MQTQPRNLGTRSTQVSHPIAITYRSISELKLNPQNPRIHSPKQIRQIARSIRAFGFNVPVLINSTQQVIAGHGRLLACQSLGITEVPTISLAHLTETQAKAFLIADNRLTENATWDEKLLAESFKELSEVELDFNLEDTGFVTAEIDLLIEGLAPATDGETDPADVLPEISVGPPVSQLGDLWVLGPHRVYCGDAREESSYRILMGNKCASIVFTDPPYNLVIDGHVSGLGKIKHREFQMGCGEMTDAEFTAFLTQACTLMARFSVDGSLHYLFMDWRHMSNLLTAGQQVYEEFKNLCVWTKSNAGMGSLYRSAHELCFVFKHGKASHRNNIQLGQFGRYRTNVWQYDGMSSFGRTTEEGNLLALHPTVKPVALVADALLDASARGEVVLDPFIGSGTSVIASERTGRICYGMEIDPLYIDTTIRRWQSFTGQIAVHGESGQSFSTLQAERGGTHG
ncbi:MAG TPA: site-specific DNA-methyltransferase [Acidimicrobiales bacterium]|nr:site-specific DNA-methyltransferase [Acidimicrobiales bacterium]